MVRWMNEAIKSINITFYLKEGHTPPDTEELTRLIGHSMSANGYHGYTYIGDWLGPFGNAYYCDYCCQVFPKDPENPPQEGSDNYVCPDCAKEYKEDFEA